MEEIERGERDVRDQRSLQIDLSYLLLDVSGVEGTLHWKLLLLEVGEDGCSLGVNKSLPVAEYNGECPHKMLTVSTDNAGL
jgi:hypothetical protein